MKKIFLVLALLAFYSCARAMGDYFDVTGALELSRQAVKKDAGKSFSVALVSALIDARYQMDHDWGKVYQVVNDVLDDQSLRTDMRLSAVNGIMQYINAFQGY